MPPRRARASRSSSRSRSPSRSRSGRTTRGSEREPYKPLDPDCIMYKERSGSNSKKFHEEGTGKWKSGNREDTRVPWYFTNSNKDGKSPSSSAASTRKNPPNKNRVRKYFRRSKRR